MTATAAPPSEPLVAQRADATIFRSARRELRLVYVASQPILGPGGARQGQTIGRTVEFKPDDKHGFLRVDDAYMEDFNREHDEKVSRDALVAWLKGHRRYDDKIDGFWEYVEAAPAVTQDEFQRIVDAATAFDREKIEAIIAAETAGWQRPAVLEPAHLALSRLREYEAAIAAQETAERAQAEASKSQTRGQAKG